MKIRDIDTLLIDSPGRKWTFAPVPPRAGLGGVGAAANSNTEPAG